MPKEKDNVIHIDKKVYKTTQSEMTGIELRALAQPKIGEMYDLVVEVPSGEDRIIGNQEIVSLKNGLHFFSVPKNITPGR